jgi:hypothetical protein
MAGGARIVEHGSPGFSAKPPRRPEHELVRRHGLPGSPRSAPPGRFEAKVIDVTAHDDPTARERAARGRQFPAEIASGGNLGACVALSVLVLGAGALPARAQGSSGPASQIWVEACPGKRLGERSSVRLDVEPKWQVSSGTWRSFDLTPRLEHYPLDWLDLVGQTEIGRTVQSGDQKTVEITPRVGVRLHLFATLARLRDRLGREPRLALSRLHVSTLVRVEWRNCFYSDDTPNSHEWRARFQVAGELAINHVSLAQDHTLYAVADVEYYLPLTDDVSERYVNKTRARAGLGYRASKATRVEVLFVRDWNRHSPGGGRSEDVQAVDVRAMVHF